MIYQFYIELQETKPLVWRRIIVPADFTFYQLHIALQGAFGWENAHLFQFSENGFLDKTCYGIRGDDIETDSETIDAKKIKMKSILKQEGQTNIYIYDFGDGWKHRLTLEKIEEKEFDNPYCLDGSGACPPEDVGGIGGYENMIEVFNEPGHPKQEEYRQWIGMARGEKWDANYCNIREVNKRLALVEALT